MIFLKPYHLLIQLQLTIIFHLTCLTYEPQKIMKLHKESESALAPKYTAINGHSPILL